MYHQQGLDGEYKCNGLGFRISVHEDGDQSGVVFGFGVRV